MRVHGNVSCAVFIRPRIRSAIFATIPVLLPYVGSFRHLWEIPLPLPYFGFARSVVVFANYSYLVCCLGRLGKRFVWQELNIRLTHAMLLYHTWKIRMIALRLWNFTNLRKGWQLKLLNTRAMYCLHHSVACAFNQHCIVHTTENYFENKLWLFISISSACVCRGDLGIWLNFVPGLCIKMFSLSQEGHAV